MDKYETSNMEMFDLIDREAFNKLVNECSLLITHGGVGSILTGLKANKKVIACPRLFKYKEHINDHQTQIINEFAKAGYILAYNENDYVRLLQTDCYSPRTKKYLDQRLEEYNNLVSEIENVKEQIEEITDKYKMESEIAAKLNSIKKETYGIMTWINSSDFKILKNETTNAVNNLFKSYEELFNENQQKFKKADEELVKTNEISADLGKKEKEAREELTRLTKEKKSTIKEYYEKVEEVIELDENMKKQANEMAAITGIDDSEIINPRRENKFDSLRSDD